MATRGSIARKNEDGTITAIYSHWDSYISYNGQVLQEYYNHAQKLDTLLSLGDVSCLRPLIGEQHPFDNPHKFGTDEYKAHRDKYDGWCLFYGRDRGEKNCEAKTYKDAVEWLAEIGQEYNYLSIDGVWYVNDHEETDEAGLPVFTLLETVIEVDKAQRAA